MSVREFRPRFQPPPTYGEPCSCAECRVAGVAGERPIRTPNGELHGVKLRDHLAAKARFDAAAKALADSRLMT